ncbi:MAG: hypothetical protein ACR2HR_03800 [Euzebya sp.]
MRLLPEAAEAAEAEAEAGEPGEPGVTASGSAGITLEDGPDGVLTIRCTTDGEFNQAGTRSLTIAALRGLPIYLAAGEGLMSSTLDAMGAAGTEVGRALARRRSSR